MDKSKTQFKTEGENPFAVADTENENSPESSTEKMNAESTESPDQDKNGAEETKDSDKKDANFADHPRWKEREDDWTKRFNDQERRHLDEIEKLRMEFGQKGGAGPKTEKASPAEIPPWFGGDEEQWKQFLDWNQSLVSKAEENFRKSIAEKAEAEQKAIDEATKFFNDSVQSIESDKTANPKGLKVDRNKLLKFVLDNELVDTKGRWNYRAGWIMMNGVHSASPDTERKKIAGATTSEKGSESSPPSFMTSADFSKPGNRPW